MAAQTGASSPQEGTGRGGRARTTWHGGMGGTEGGRKEMHMTDGFKGKVVFSSFFELFSLFRVMCSRPKHSFTVC